MILLVILLILAAVCVTVYFLCGKFDVDAVFAALDTTLYVMMIVCLCGKISERFALSMMHNELIIHDEKTEEYLVFIPLSSEELDMVNVNDSISDFKYDPSLGDGCIRIVHRGGLLSFSRVTELKLNDGSRKCKLLSSREVYEFSKCNLGFYIFIRDENNIKKLMGVYDEFELNGLEISNYSVSLTYKLSRSIDYQRHLKLWLLSSPPDFGLCRRNICEFLIVNLFSSLKDGEPICPGESNDDSSTNEAVGRYWIDSDEGKIVVSLLKMFDPAESIFNITEALTKKNLCYNKKDFSKAVECIVNYIRRNNMTVGQYDIERALGFSYIWSFVLRGRLSGAYRLLDCKMCINDSNLKEKICSDLNYEVYRYIFAIACYQGHEISDTGISKDCPVETNSQIKELLNVQHKDVLKLVHGVLDDCHNVNEPIKKNSAGYRLLNISSMPYEVGEGTVVKELVDFARSLVVERYKSVMAKYLPFETIVGEIKDDTGFIFPIKSITEYVWNVGQRIGLVDEKILDLTFVECCDNHANERISERTHV
ncbi:MAG: hypothetical protein ACTJLM_04965 [Ehrlichia sp.]